MRGARVLGTAILLLSVAAVPAVAQSVTSVDPPIIGQSIARASVRINVGSGNIDDGLTITIANDSFDVAHQGTWIYEFNTSGGLNNGAAIEVVPPTADSYDAFSTLESVINSDPTAPLFARFFTDVGWFTMVWKYDNEWGLSGGPPHGVSAMESGDTSNVISFPGHLSFPYFPTTNPDTGPVFLQLRGTGLNALVLSSSVKLRHQVNTSELYDGIVTVRHDNVASVSFRTLNAGNGSPPTFPSVGVYDLEINGSPTGLTVTLVENLLDDPTARVHASGSSVAFQWFGVDLLPGPHWMSNPYPDSDIRDNGSVQRQTCPRIYPFPTGNAKHLGNDTNDVDDENISLQWSADSGVHRFWQTVNVDFVADTTLTLTGLWAAGSGHYAMSYGAQLRAGDEDGTIIAETPPGQQVITPFDWTDFSVSGVFPGGTTQVTVVFYGDHPATFEKALHVDSLLLRVDNDHPAPPQITGMTTPAYATIDTASATITLTGDNLTAGQTSVTLRAPDIMIGDRVEWANGDLQLVDDDEDSFAAYEYGAGDKVVLTSGSGVILGEYDIAGKDDDQTITLVSDINGDGGDVGESITGYIVKAPIAADSVTASGTQVSATFDLTGVPAGYLNIIVEVGTHDPIVWREGFNVVYVGPYLVNGSFELPEAPQDCEGTRSETYTPASDWKARFWNGYMAGPGPILQFRDDEWSTTGFPSCPAPELGVHYHSTATQSDNGTAQYYQTVTATPGQDYTLRGFFANRSEGGASNSVTLELLDGNSAAAPMSGASVEVLSSAVDGGTDWTFAYVAGTATDDIMTAAWEVQANGVSNPHVADADGLILEECTAPVTITSVDPYAVPSDDFSPVTLTITGSGFSGTTPEVILARLGETLYASNINVLNDNLLTCDVTDLPQTFDVSAYDVVVRNNGCIDSVPNGFVRAPTTILDGQFEEPYADLHCDELEPNLDPLTYWESSGDLIREGDVHAPAECPLLSCACPVPTTGCSGGHYASMSTGEGEELRAWQTLKVNPGAGCVFGGWFSSGGTGTVNMKLVDGYGPDGAVLATAAVPQANEWCYSFVEGFAAGHLVTVMWELVGTVNGTPSAVHADFMTFESTICHQPFADADFDGDVDQDDLGVFQLCYTGSTGTIPLEPEYCACLDIDGDDHIDDSDYALFEQCASGPEVPANPTCAE
jgi:hypothetical protein